MQRALFVTHRSHIGPGKGGVQNCTNEYLRVIRQAGIELDIVEVFHDTRPTTRAIRQLHSSAYFRSIDRNLLATIARRASDNRSEAIFFNQVALASASNAIARLEPTPTLKIALSHGCEITDLAHAARLKSSLPLSARLRPTPQLALGATLWDELRSRKSLDGVVALSPFDAATEEWLGTRQVAWLPRLVAPAPLDWKPLPNLFGFVGTLDHAPNLEGLVQILSQVSQEDSIKVRVVGGPPSIGQWLVDRFPCVDYLGQLDDDQLRAEAAGWRAFLNPIFCRARGCSTKLATALGWEIPIVTSEIGRRGYVWSEGEVLEGDTPSAFVRHMHELFDDGRAAEAQAKVKSAAASAPKIEELGRMLSVFLSGLRKV